MLKKPINKVTNNNVCGKRIKSRRFRVQRVSEFQVNDNPDYLKPYLATKNYYDGQSQSGSDQGVGGDNGCREFP